MKGVSNEERISQVRNSERLISKQAKEDLQVGQSGRAFW